MFHMLEGLHVSIGSPILACCFASDLLILLGVHFLQANDMFFLAYVCVHAVLARQSCCL